MLEDELAREDFNGDREESHTLLLLLLVVLIIFLGGR
jgi:hypothetical protein